MSHLELTLNIEGATEEEMLRGLLAAKDVFERAGVCPWEAAFAADHADADDEDCDCLRLPREEEEELADTWKQADRAALDACCVGWRNKPPTAGLKVARDDEDDGGETVH
jgi:hypothetical protein